MLTQPQQQPITELSSITYNCLSLFHFIFSHPSEGSSSTHGRKHRNVNYPATRLQSERAAEAAELCSAQLQLLLMGGKGSREPPVL